MIITILVFLLILSVLVLIHEWGHYFVAKKLGIKVEEFGFGIPPRAFGIKRGETIYSINWLPVGGFVKLYGEDEAGGGRVRIKDKGSGMKEEKEDEERAFYARPVWQRALVVVAGVVMNSVLAVVIFYLFLTISGFKTELPLLGDHAFFGVNQNNVTEVMISSIAKNSPAEEAGITELSKIVSLNSQPITKTSDVVAIINAHKGKEIHITWKIANSSQELSSVVIPRVSPPKNEGALGIGFFPINKAILSYDTLPQKAFSGIVHPLNLLSYNFDILGQLVAISFKQKTVEPVSQGVAGPVGIFSLVGTIVQIPDLKEKIQQVLNLAGILSISLAFFNILPIPALDGGRLFFILIEGLSGKKVNPKYEGYAHAIGMAVLLGLIALVTLQDISRLFR